MLCLAFGIVAGIASDLKWENTGTAAAIAASAAFIAALFYYFEDE